MRRTGCSATAATSSASGPEPAHWHRLTPRAAAASVGSMSAPDAPLPPRPRASFRTRNRDEAVESVERLYGPHTLELKSRGVLDMQLSGLDIGTLNLSSIQYGCPATAHTPLPHDHWVFSTCLRGEIMVGPQRAKAGYSGV